jgi:hypothetical protein
MENGLLELRKPREPTQCPKKEKPRMKRNLLVLAGIALLGGCASPWVSYQEAVRCHLDDKGPVCDAKYQKAIQQNTKMPGVHSSYGTHLLLEGKSDQAAEEFKLEQQNYPTESSKAIGALMNPTAAVASTAGPVPLPVAVPATDSTTKAAPSASVNAPSAPTTSPKPSPTVPSKAAAAKKGASHAK